MWSDILIWGFLCCACLMLGWRLFKLTRACNACVHARARAEQSRIETARLLGLAAQELHLAGLQMLGHAGASDQRPDLITATAADLLSLADELHAAARPADAPHILRRETINLDAMLPQAVEAAATHLAPGQRSWRLPSDGQNRLISADPRALRHILARVLASAIRNTGQQDWIEISTAQRPDGMAITIQDEGNGLAQGSLGKTPHDSRGIGLRLTLARSLMHAHGGKLEVESRAGVGSRISLVFPIAA